LEEALHGRSEKISSWQKKGEIRNPASGIKLPGEKVKKTETWGDSLKRERGKTGGKKIAKKVPLLQEAKVSP